MPEQAGRATPPDGTVLAFDYGEKKVQFWAEIYPGQVTYFTFTDEDGFQVHPPPVPTLDFLPRTATPLP